MKLLGVEWWKKKTFCIRKFFLKKNTILNKNDG